MLRWLLSAALLVALPVAELHAADLTGTLKQIQQTGKGFLSSFAKPARSLLRHAEHDAVTVHPGVSDEQA